MKVKDIPNEATVYTTKYDVDGILQEVFDTAQRDTRKYTHKDYPVVFQIDNDNRVWGIRKENVLTALEFNQEYPDWEQDTEVDELV